MPRKKTANNRRDTGFGVKLTTLRAEAGLTQLQLARLAGIHTQTLVMLETGKSDPTWQVVLDLADALGVSVEAFRWPKGAIIPRMVARLGRPRRSGVLRASRRDRSAPKEGKDGKGKEENGEEEA